ncbi:MAG: Rid family detoxifying hydrolase [Synergistaceae bacterium]|jgi:2-iminobutanoate/2-iminopropanoate deaminase|nr:Rid family detoxifying hydrolase [Synergistaceae bacterium]
MKKTVSTDRAPAAIGPYSQAVWAGDFLFCSGQLGLVPAKGALAGPDIESQTEQALANIAALLESEGLSPADVVKTLVFLTDMGSFKKFNEIYGRVFGSEPPARSCVAAAALPLGGVVEIEVIAHRR